MAIGTVHLPLKNLMGERLGKLRAGIGMASEAFFILRDGGCLWGGSVNAMATETGHLPFAMTGTNAADLAGAILVAAEADGFTS